MSKIYQRKISANGLKIVTHRMPGRRSAALGIWINTGGRYESSANKGIAHVLEHLLFKGSKKYSCRLIKESIEGVGGSLNGFTSEELTCYLVKIPKDYLSLALDILSDMVLNPVLSAADIVREKTVILEELKMYKDLPQSYVHELLDELLWPGQPLGAPIIGTVESVNGVSRDTLSLFKNNYYTPSNMVISAAGEFDPAKLTKSISRHFCGQKQRQKNTFIPARESQKDSQLKVFDKPTEQTHMALGFHALPRDHRLKHALGLLHTILGANMSSRLFNEVREKKGLAYEIGTQVKRFRDTGAFVVHAGMDNRRVSDALQVILRELKKAKEKPVSRDEFKRAKEFYLGQLSLALEDTLDHMLWIGESTAILDRTYSLDDIISEVKKVKRDDLREVAGYIFKEEKLNLALIGPLKDKEKHIRSQLTIN